MSVINECIEIHKRRGVDINQVEPYDIKEYMGHSTWSPGDLNSQRVYWDPQKTCSWHQPSRTVWHKGIQGTNYVKDSLTMKHCKKNDWSRIVQAISKIWIHMCHVYRCFVDSSINILFYLWFYKIQNIFVNPGGNLGVKVYYHSLTLKIFACFDRTGYLHNAFAVFMT